MPSAFAREKCVLPLFLDNDVLALALADPDDVLLLDAIKLFTRCEVQPFIATRPEIMKAIDEFYGRG